MLALGRSLQSWVSFRAECLTCCSYCFGAPYVMNSISPDGSSPPVCDVGAFAHPAFLKEHHFENIQRPLCLSCAETDFTFETEAYVYQRV